MGLEVGFELVLGVTPARGTLLGTAEQDAVPAPHLSSSPGHPRVSTPGHGVSSVPTPACGVSLSPLPVHPWPLGSSHPHTSQIIPFPHPTSPGRSQTSQRHPGRGQAVPELHRDPQHPLTSKPWSLDRGWQRVGKGLLASVSLGSDSDTSPAPSLGLIPPCRTPRAEGTAAR